MKRLLVISLFVATLTPALAQQITTPKDIDSEPDFIFIQEIHLWTALQAHELATFQASLLPDFLYIERTIQTREQIMVNLNTCTLASFHFNNHQIRVLSPDAVILSYTAATDTTCGESHLRGNYNATTTWVRRDGKWFVQIHTETPTPKS
jgi:hypothetical protein